MRTAIWILCSWLTIGLGSVPAQELEEIWFNPYGSLAQRDEYGVLHSSKQIDPPDLAPRYRWRPLYYLEGGKDLVRQPAYVGALQSALGRLGYYCGPVDGVYTDEVSTAIAHLQKNYSMRVTGTITIGVRRALHLP